MPYITTHRHYLEQYHYILQATEPWFNFSKSTLNRYIAEYGDDFCLVLNRSNTSDYVLILPFAEFKHLFTNETLAEDKRRWMGNILDNMDQIRVSSAGHEASICGYQNAFHLLQHAPQPLPKPPDLDFD
jgi:hypothetical protein